MALTQHQQEVMEGVATAIKQGVKRVVVKGSAGVGKLQPYTEPVLTPNGWVTMREIVEGSQVVCPVTGQSINVLRVFPGKDLIIYKVHFSDGTWTECCQDHLWKVQVYNHGKYTDKILSIKEMIDKGITRKDGTNKFKIPLTNPVHFKAQGISLDPYLLGLLIGNGYLPSEPGRACTLSCHTDDSENLYKLLKDIIPSDVGIRLDRKYDVNSNTGRIVFSSSIKKYLLSMDLLGKKSGDKFIPHNYLYNTVEVRKEILAGMMDTDGHCDISTGTRKKVSYSTTSDVLEKDIKEIVQSLGGLATTTIDSRDKYKDGKKCYKIHIRTPFNPFYKKSKADDFNSISYKYHWNKAIVNIEYVRHDDGQCILVDSDYHLYITRGYNVTHNTYMVNQLIMYLKNYLKGGLVCISAPTHKALSVLFSKVKLDEGVNMNLEFKTIHSALQLERNIDWETGKQTFTRKPYNPRFPPLDRVQLIVLDEASMVNSELLKYLDEFPGIPVIFIGDDKQLNPVGEPISPVFAKGYPEFELTEIIRQGEGNPIIELSRNLSFIKTVKHSVTDKGLGFTYTYDKNKVIDRLAEVNGTDDFKYLSYTNVDVDIINKQVRERIYGNPKKIEIGETLVFKSPFEEYHVSDELLVRSLEVVEQDYYVPNHLTNIKKGKMGIEILTSYDVATDTYMIIADKVKLKVYIINGNIPVVHEDSEKEFKKIVTDLRAKCKAKSVSWLGFYWFTELFADLTYNHALTVHKSQGSTYKKAVINIGNIDINKNPDEKQRLLYTAVTRASDMVVLYNIR